MQQTGRAGRDGDRSSALLYYNASDIGNNVSAMDNAMRDYCRSETCLRHAIANYFLYNIDERERNHDCCSVCMKQCTCSQCK